MTMQESDATAEMNRRVESPLKQAVSVGRMVHFFTKGEVHAAMIVCVVSNRMSQPAEYGTVNLVWWDHTGDQHAAIMASYSELPGTLEGHWNWPPRV